MKCVACTIVSANYLHYAWTLAESFFKYHPDDEFHLLMVDRLPADFVTRNPQVRITEVEQLTLPDFRSLAFKFDLLELNTAVKPTFLKHLFDQGAKKVIYFDPDIYLYQPVTLIFGALEQASAVVTPHLLAPTTDPDHTYEKDLLVTGVFNLGFIAVSNTAQGRSFLDWWEDRCLRFGFQDLRMGLFVDQKWVNFAQCFFDEISVLRHKGCNVAYWNLAERSVSEDGGVFMIDGAEPLIFYHFSGYNPNAPNQVSSKLRLQLPMNSAVERLLVEYGKRLEANAAHAYQDLPYSYANFSDGSIIPSVARRLYSVTMDKWAGTDPFDVAGPFYAAARKARILSRKDQSGKYSSNNLPVDDWRIKAINRFLFFLPRIIGGDRYTMLMKYLSYITILRHQRQLLLDDEAQSARF
jgi:hypothetical protein